MSYEGGTVVREINFSSPTRRIDIVARNDGNFQAVENLAIGNDPANGWTPNRTSGLYQNADETEHAAREMWETFNFGGMTVNERLFCMGTIEDFDTARQNKDRKRLVFLLEQIGLADQADQIVKSL